MARPVTQAAQRAWQGFYRFASWPGSGLRAVVARPVAQAGLRAWPGLLPVPGLALVSCRAAGRGGLARRPGCLAAWPGVLPVRVAGPGLPPGGAPWWPGPSPRLPSGPGPGVLPVRVASQAVCRGDPARRPGWPAGLAGVPPVAKLARLFALGQSHLAFMIRKDLGCSRPKNAYGS